LVVVAVASAQASFPETNRAGESQREVDAQRNQLISFTVGAPEEIRTPDPQIRSLVRAFDFIGGVVEPATIRESFQDHRRAVPELFDPH